MNDLGSILTTYEIEDLDRAGTHCSVPDEYQCQFCGYNWSLNLVAAVGLEPTTYGL